VAWATGYLAKDFATLTSDKRILGLSIAEAICLMAAELLIGFSITSKNATLSGLIEISYPLFIAIFAYLLFNDNQMNAGTVVGGALIFSGIFVIYYLSH
jgi:drug/metabolite transporter (DMT)-like permease